MSACCNWCGAGESLGCQLAAAGVELPTAAMPEAESGGAPLFPKLSDVAGFVQIAMGCALVPLSLRSLSMRLDDRYQSAVSGCVTGPIVMAAGAAAILLQLCHRFCLKCLLVNNLICNLSAFLACLIAAVCQMEILPPRKGGEFVGPEGSVTSPETFEALYLASIAIFCVSNFFCFCQAICSSTDCQQRYCQGSSSQPLTQAGPQPAGGGAYQPMYQVQMQPVGAVHPGRDAGFSPGQLLRLAPPPDYAAASAAASAAEDSKEAA